jgi:hypothetical protein
VIDAGCARGPRGSKEAKASFLPQGGREGKRAGGKEGKRGGAYRSNCSRASGYFWL